MRGKCIKKYRGNRVAVHSDLFKDEYYMSESGLSEIKAYMYTFIIAYFAAKKFMGYEGLDFLFHLAPIQSEEDKLKFKDFLYILKMGMCLTNLTEPYADAMIEEFVITVK